MSESPEAITQNNDAPTEDMFIHYEKLGVTPNQVNNKKSTTQARNFQ